MKNTNIKKLIENSFSNYISKSTIIGIINSILKPVAYDSVKALILTRFRNVNDVDSLIKRLEYSQNINIFDLTNSSLLKIDDFKTIEFLLVTSARFNIFIAWDFENNEKDKSKLFFLANSRLINDCFEMLRAHMKQDLSEEFYSYRPERRENILLNEVLTNIIDILNDSIQENEFMNKEDIEVAEKLEKLDSLKEISHEVKNQLSIIEINTKIIEKKYQNIEEIKTLNKAVEIIKYHLNEIKNINSKEQKADISEVIEETIKISSGYLRESKNDIIFNNNLNSEFQVNSEKLKGALLNIIQNANEVTNNDKIEINLKKINNYIEISIINHGMPIEEKNKIEIFNSGFTTKEHGWGIGLYITKKNIEKLGGEISLKESSSEKTEFLIKLPIKNELIGQEIYF